MSNTIRPYDMLKAATLAHMQLAHSGKYEEEAVDAYVKGFSSGYAMAACIASGDIEAPDTVKAADNIVAGFEIQQKLAKTGIVEVVIHA